MEQRAFWITLTIVLFYLIARPRIGTVWYVDADSAETAPIASAPFNWADPHATPSAQSNPFLSNTPAPGVKPRPPGTAFLDRRDCIDAAAAYERDAGLVGVYCASKNALLWGW